MKRDAEIFLDAWISSSNRKPLIIRGARQVGKSTLVRNFAAGKGLHLVEINLEQSGKSNFWKTNQVNIIIREIELIANKHITPDSLLFIDEIQENPAAITALRYFYEEVPQIPVIAAGSLLEFTLNNTGYSMPVGRVQFYHLYPMTFKEVLMAGDESLLLESLAEASKEGEIPTTAHEKLQALWKEFMFVGGMPEAVSSNLQGGGLKGARDVHRSIVQTFRYDFGKYGKRNIERIETLFDYVPVHSGEKIKYSNISKNNQARDLKESLDCLIKARIAFPVYHSDCSGIPLKSGENKKVYKCYFMDTGLSSYMQGMKWRDFQLDPSNLINSGKLTEQFVAQHLFSRERGIEAPELHYWLREGRSGNAEVDFVINNGAEIIPIEVKSGKAGAIRSLHQFMYSKGSGKALRFDANPPSQQTVSADVRTKKGTDRITYTLDSFPVYMVEQVISDILDRQD
ncbi:MAG: AAA+ family ATPase [Spirochaetes bacterium]|nr:MAG: AAA+ family ATPase [Spirochaetota bacterium]